MMNLSGKNNSRNDLATKQLADLNKEKVKIGYGVFCEMLLFSTVHPSALTLPDGWNFIEDSARSRGEKLDMFDSVLVFLKPDGGAWPGLAYPIEQGAV